MVQSSTVSRAVIFLAATVVVIAGARLASPILSPLLLAIFFATLTYPVYGWLRRSGLGVGLALGILALVLVGVVVGLGLIIWLSVAQLANNLGQYQALLEQRLTNLEGSFTALGLGSGALIASADASRIIGLLASFVSSVTGLVINFFFVVLAVIFLVADGPRAMRRFRDWLGENHTLATKLSQFAPAVQQYFGLRSYLNALTGLVTGIGLWLLGIDFAPLWGITIFFLSYVPYLGAFLGAVPPVVLALAEFGLGRAFAVIALITIINMVLENIIMPRMMGRGFSLSPFVVFTAFTFWTWLLGPAGALLSMALTNFVVLVLESFPETRGLARVLKSDDESQTATKAKRQTGIANSADEQHDPVG